MSYDPRLGVSRPISYIPPYEESPIMTQQDHTTAEELLEGGVQDLLASLKSRLREMDESTLLLAERLEPVLTPVGNEAAEKGESKVHMNPQSPLQLELTRLIQQTVRTIEYIDAVKGRVVL